MLRVPQGKLSGWIECLHQFSLLFFSPHLSSLHPVISVQSVCFLIAVTSAPWIEVQYVSRWYASLFLFPLQLNHSLLAQREQVHVSVCVKQCLHMAVKALGLLPLWSFNIFIPPLPSFPSRVAAVWEDCGSAQFRVCLWMSGLSALPCLLTAATWNQRGFNVSSLLRNAASPELRHSPGISGSKSGNLSSGSLTSCLQLFTLGQYRNNCISKLSTASALEDGFLSYVLFYTRQYFTWLDFSLPSYWATSSDFSVFVVTLSN